MLLPSCGFPKVTVGPQMHSIVPIFCVQLSTSRQVTNAGYDFCPQLPKAA